MITPVSAIGVASQPLAFDAEQTAPPIKTQTQRPPQSSDDSTRGMVAGYQWTSPIPPRTWRCVTATPGAARWRGVNLGSALPADVISITGVRGLYGLVKLRAAYTGNCVRIVRASDSTTLDAGFVKTRLPNGRVVEVVDQQAIADFLAGTTGTVDIWYDQSALGNNALQTTAAARPQWGENAVGWHPSVTFSTNQSNASQARFLEVTSGATIDLARRACSVIVAGRNRGSLVQSCFFQGLPSPANNANQIRFSFGMGTGTEQPSMGINNEYGGFLATSDELIAGIVTATPASATYWCNSRRLTTTMTTSAVTTTGGWNLTTNTTAGSTTSHFDGLVWMIYNRTMTEAEQLDVTAALAEVTGIYLQPPPNRIVAFGNSIEQGTGTVLNRNRWFFERNLYDVPVEVVNLGVGGRQLSADLAGIETLLTTAYDVNFPRTVFLIGGNIGADVLASRSARQMYEDLSRLTQRLRNVAEAGQRVRIVCATFTPSTAPTTAQEEQARALYGLMTANRAQWDGFVDILADPIWGAAGAASDTTLTADGVHPTELGYNYLASLYHRAIRPHLLTG